MKMMPFFARVVVNHKTYSDPSGATMVVLMLLILGKTCCGMTTQVRTT